MDVNHYNPQQPDDWLCANCKRWNDIASRGCNGCGHCPARCRKCRGFLKWVTKATSVLCEACDEKTDIESIVKFGQGNISFRFLRLFGWRHDEPVMPNGDLAEYHTLSFDGAGGLARLTTQPFAQADKFHAEVKELEIDQEDVQRRIARFERWQWSRRFGHFFTGAAS